MKLIGGEISLWSDFENRRVPSPDTPVLISDAEPLWAFVATQAVRRSLRILAVGPSAVSALASIEATGWDAVLRAHCDARATESVPGARFVYCGSALRFEPQEQYDLVLCLDNGTTVLGNEDSFELGKYVELILSWGTEALFIVENTGSVLRRRSAASNSIDVTYEGFFEDWAKWELEAMAAFGSRSLVGPGVQASAPLAEGLLYQTECGADALGAARVLARTGQIMQQAPSWLWGTSKIMEVLPATAWVESSPVGLGIHETHSRVLVAWSCESIQQWPDVVLRVGPAVVEAPKTHIPSERLEDLWIAAVTSPSALRALVRDWDASLQSLPEKVLPFASPDLMDQDGNFLDMGWRWNRSLSPNAARAVCLRRFARRLVLSGTPHQWHALSTVDAIAESLLLMCGIEGRLGVADEFEVGLGEALHRGANANEVQNILLGGGDAAVQLASMSRDQMRRLVGLLSGELQSERDKADAEAVRARSQDWRITKLNDELAAYRRSIPYRVHRATTAPKRILKAQAKALVARVLPMSAQEKIRELIRRAQREAGQKSS